MLLIIFSVIVIAFPFKTTREFSLVLVASSAFPLGQGLLPTASAHTGPSGRSDASADCLDRVRSQDL